MKSLKGEEFKRRKVRPVNNSLSGQRTKHKSAAFHSIINKKSLSLFCALMPKGSVYATTTEKSHSEAEGKGSSLTTPSPADMRAFSKILYSK